MPTVTPRSGKFQLRVTHKLLPKPFFHTFEEEAAAHTYGQQLEALLARGIVPQELLSPDRAVTSPLFKDMIESYQKDPDIRLAATDIPVFSLLTKEVETVRMTGVTFIWASELLKKYKAKKLAPGTIRKRIGALSRVLSWYHRTTAKNGQEPQANVLKMLPRGYSQYADGSKKDVERDIRLTPDAEAAIRKALGGEKADDKERAWGEDPELELFFTLIVETGLRLKEAFWLRVDQYDVARGVLNVSGTKGHHGKIKPRTVPLKRGIRDRLTEWCAGKSGLMFSFWDGTPEDLKRCSARLSARFTTLFAYAKVPDFTEHDLRHEACCRWVQLKNANGWAFNDTEIVKIMGWSNTSMLLRYASLRGEDLANRLG